MASAHGLCPWFPPREDEKCANRSVSNLYVGQNSLKQHVLTWVAKNTTEKFHGDLMPLVTKLMGMRGANFPKTTDYLGYMGLGSEALSTSEPVTFWVPELSIDIRTTP